MAKYTFDEALQVETGDRAYAAIALSDLISDPLAVARIVNRYYVEVKA